MRSHPLRPRQQLLLDATLPRLRFPEAQAADPLAAFGPQPDLAGASAFRPDPTGTISSRPDRLWLEVGFGGGEHAEALAAANPGAGLIACEVFENGLCSLLSRLVPEGGEADAPLPGNLRLWDDDARLLLRLLPPGSLDRVFLMFPDPWPKMRHAKRRFVHPAQVALVARAMRPGGEWRVASDDPTYQAWVGEVMAGQDLFAAPAPAAARPDGWPPTRYEAKALRAGRAPSYWTFTRNGLPASGPPLT